MVTREERKRVVLAILKNKELSFRKKREAVRVFIEEGEDSLEGKKCLSLLTSKNLKESELEIKECKDRGIEIAEFNSEKYPSSLSDISDSPGVLYINGKLPEESKNRLWISIVGSRKASRESLIFSEKLAKNLAANGVVVVSGLALGIDAACHRGALVANREFLGAYAGVAVLGSGVLNIYPSKNISIAREIVKREGAVISEYSLMSPPKQYHFPERNRIISGLSHGTVVVEARNRSGSLITARLALEQGRDVFSVPGAPNKKENEGSNHLIKQGAFLIENEEDIFSHYPWFKRSNLVRRKGENKKDINSKIENKILDLLSKKKSIPLNDLKENLEIEINELLQIITLLELKGLIYKHPGDLISIYSFS